MIACNVTTTCKTELLSAAATQFENPVILTASKTVTQSPHVMRWLKAKGLKTVNQGQFSTAKSRTCLVYSGQHQYLGVRVMIINKDGIPSLAWLFVVITPPKSDQARYILEIGRKFDGSGPFFLDI